MSEQSTIESQQMGTSSLWVGVIGAPLLWLIQLAISYALVPWVCHTRKFVPLHLVTIASLAAVIGAMIVCQHEYERVGREEPKSADAGRFGAARLTALVGLLQCMLLVLGLMIQWMAIFLIDPCWD